MGLASVIQLPVPMDLVTVPKHLIQSFLHVPTLGAEHHALRNVKGSRHLLSTPAFVRPEQDAGPSDCLGRTPAGPDHPPEPPFFLCRQPHTIFLLNHECHTSHNTASSPKIASRPSIEGSAKAPWGGVRATYANSWRLATSDLIPRNRWVKW